MPSISHERKRLMTKVSVMYYNEGLSQQQITEKLNISRPQVSRMLSNARAEGIVDIIVKDSFADERKYETWLCRTFNLENAVVVDTGSKDDQANLRMIADALTEILESAINDDDVIGISAGNSLGDVCSEIRAWANKKIAFVPLIGGIGIDGTRWQANLNVRRFAEIYKAKSWQLSAPMVVTSDTTYEAIIKEPEISKVLDIAKKCDIAITGIGQFSREATIIRTGFLGESDIEELTDKGAKASVCGSFLNEDGNDIMFNAQSRIIGLTTNDLSKIREVIAISWGENKVEAITAALKGNWMKTLVTTLETAKKIVRYMQSDNELE